MNGRGSIRTRSLAGATALLLALACFNSGCARIKRFAYEGFFRDRWQRPDQVIQHLDIQPGAHVADLGAGGGYFTFRLAEVVGASAAPDSSP